MHREWGLPALLTGVCLASSCGGGGSDRSPFTPTVASWCQGPWSLSVSARGGAVAVGHSVSADALVFTPFDQQATFLLFACRLDKGDSQRPRYRHRNAGCRSPQVHPHRGDAGADRSGGRGHNGRRFDADDFGQLHHRSSGHDIELSNHVPRLLHAPRRQADSGEPRGPAGQAAMPDPPAVSASMSAARRAAPHERESTDHLM